MKNVVMTVCFAAIAAAGAAAQDKMMPMSKPDTAPMAMTATYAGCVERTDEGKFRLTHATSKDAMHSGHEMMQDKPSMNGETMAPAITLTGTRVKLEKYVGQKVSLTGTSSGESLSVASVKTIAKSCR